MSKENPVRVLLVSTSNAPVIEPLERLLFLESNSSNRFVLEKTLLWAETENSFREKDSGEVVNVFYGNYSLVIVEVFVRETSDLISALNKLVEILPTFSKIMFFGNHRTDSDDNRDEILHLVNHLDSLRQGNGDIQYLFGPVGVNELFDEIFKRFGLNLDGEDR